MARVEETFSSTTSAYVPGTRPKPYPPFESVWVTLPTAPFPRGTAVTVTGWLRTADPFTRTLPWTCTGMGVRAIGISVRSWIGEEDPIGRSAKPAAVTSPAYVRLAKSGIRNSPVPFVVKTMCAPRSSVRLTRAPAIASPGLTPLFRFASRYTVHPIVSDVATRAMLRRVVAIKVRLAKDAPAWLNATRSYVPTGRKVKYPPAVSVWSQTWAAAFPRATVAPGFRTAGFASVTVPLSRTPCTNIASKEVVLPRATTTRPNVAYNRFEA